MLIKDTFSEFNAFSLHTDIYSASEVAKQLIGNSVNIVVVGVGGKVDRSYLEALSGTVLNYASLDNVDANAVCFKIAYAFAKYIKLDIGPSQITFFCRF